MTYLASLNWTLIYTAFNLLKTYKNIGYEQFLSVLAILAEWQRYGDGDNRKLAYILGTAWHESHLKPIREKKAKETSIIWTRYQSKYWNTGYYGRGFVQLTWRRNYERMSEVFNIDLVGNPDLALRRDVAAKILVWGMMQGEFTGKSLSSYFNDSQENWYHARRIVNGILVGKNDTGRVVMEHSLMFYKQLS